MRAQQASVPIVALISSGRLPESLIGIFRQGLAEQGYAEGRNVVIDYRHGDNQYEHLAGLAAEFVRRQVAVIAALNSPPALAAKVATTTIPIVFMIPDDPVKLGLVASLSRPGGNATGVSFLLSDLGPKQLGLLHELVPDAKRIGLLVNPHNANVEDIKKEVVTAASAIKIDLKVVEASYVAMPSPVAPPTAPCPPRPPGPEDEDDFGLGDTASTKSGPVVMRPPFTRSRPFRRRFARTGALRAKSGPRLSGWSRKSTC